MKTRSWLFLCILLVPAVAWGQQSCTYNVTPTLNFGTINGLPTPQIDVTGNITVQCPLGNHPRQVCISMPVGSGGNSVADRRLVKGGSDIPFNIYRDASRTQVWGTAPSQQVSLNFPSGSGSQTLTATAYGRVFAGASGIAVGTYQSVFTGIEFNERPNVPSGKPCATGNGNTFPGSLTAQLTISHNCTITASPLDFGTVTSIGQTDANTNLSVTCTENGAYSVSLDGGATTGDVNNRQMQLGAAAIDYQLYRDPGCTQVWGDTSGTTVTGTGSGATQSIPVYGRVPAQGPKPVGTYQDTITATVEF